LWRDGEVIDLGTLPGANSYGSHALGISPSGMIVGFSHSEMNRTRQAVVWLNGASEPPIAITPSGVPNGYAYDVNSAGEVVGEGAAGAFVWRDGVMTSLGSPLFWYSEARGINEAGVIVGTTRTGSGNHHATLWVPGTAARQILIDVRPDDPYNRIPCNDPEFRIRVAILSNDWFDARTVDVNSVRFAGAAEFRRRDNGSAVEHLVDVDGNRDLDMLIQVRLRDTNLTCSSTEGILDAATKSGEPITGRDVLTMTGR
jgi:probable HAF family extracellular repeat protein